MKNNLKILRKEKHMRQIDIAKYLGINQNTYSYWERGLIKIDNESLDKLSKLFECSIDYILGNSVYREINKPLSNDEGNRILREALEKIGFINDDGSINEEGSKLISDFIIANGNILKKLIDKQ